MSRPHEQQTQVPVISLTDDDEAIAAGLAAAYEAIGFCVLVDHGVADAAFASVFDASRRFHLLPEEQKRALDLDEHHRGFIARDTSTVVTSSVAEVKRPNQSESFMVLHDARRQDQGLLLAGPNQWPTADPSIRVDVEQYRTTLTELGQRLVPHIARALGHDAEVFDGAFDHPTTWTRLLRYPPRPADAPADLFGSAPHTDYGFITLLASPDVGGLEIRHPDGRWLRPPAIPGGLVMNSGDMLHRWSNGRFRSTPHRVINDQAGVRWSVPFFFDPHVATVVAPLGLTTEERARFAPVRFEDYLRTRLRRNYRQHTNEVRHRPRPS